MLDHLLLAVSDLERGLAYVAGRSGVQPAIGGSHPRWGTRNALIALGARQYLEIIAPDPAQDQLAERYTFLRQLDRPRLWTWAAATTDIAALAERLQALGVAHTGLQEGSRARPDGRVLRWQTLHLSETFDSVLPFFIQWHPDSPHPSSDSPSGCTLEAFALEHPQPERVSRVLQPLALDVSVHAGPAPRLKATLLTPRGRVEF